MINHKIKMIIHLDKNHLNWIEDASVKDEMKSGKVTVQRVLMPNQCPGGSKEDNIGILKTMACNIALLFNIRRCIRVSGCLWVWRHNHYSSGCQKNSLSGSTEEQTGKSLPTDLQECHGQYSSE